MNRADKEALERYMARLSLARQAGKSLNPFETEEEKKQVIERMKGMCQNCHILFFYAQSPDFLKPGLCYFLKFMYLQA